MKEYSLEADPFAHTYRVAKVLEANAPESVSAETLLIHIDALCNLFLMNDTVSYNYQQIGQFKQIALPEEDTSKGLWFCYKASDRYELSVEADDAVVLTCLNNEDILWAYGLSLVDRISAHYSSSGARSHMQLNWYFANTFPNNLQLPSRPDIFRKGTLGFSVEDDSVTKLTLLEEYYTDGKVEHSEYLLTKENDFSIELQTRYEAGEQYAIYRIPFEKGEYVFCLKYA